MESEFDKKLKELNKVSTVLGWISLVCYIAMTSGIIYIAWHFISKWW